MNYKWYIPAIKQTGHIDFSDLSYWIFNYIDFVLSILKFK